MDIFIALIDEPFPYADIKLLGRRVKDYSFINVGFADGADGADGTDCTVRECVSAASVPSGTLGSVLSSSAGSASSGASCSVPKGAVAFVSDGMVDSVPDGSAAYISSGATASVSSGAGSVSAAVFNSAADVLDGAYVLADGEYDGKRYVAVVYSDMPLVTVKGLRELAAHMKKNGAAAVRIGRGVLIDRNRVQARSPILVKSAEYASVTDAAAYVAVYKEMRRRINERLIKSGVILLDGDADIDDTVKIAGGVRITGHVLIEGASVIGGGTTVGPGAVIRNSVIGGGCRIGDFVEIKASVFGDGVRAAHLAYIGDAEVGADTNVGCGAVFCNYDGVSKHKTVVGSGCFIGANVNLIAPVRVEDGCFIAAGTTVTENLKAGAFCIGRARQTVKERGKQKKTDG